MRPAAGVRAGALAFSRQWASVLEDSADAIPDQVRGHANVIATTIAALNSTELASAPSANSRFDLLVIDEAEQITEAEFAALSRCAKRWVLVGLAGSQERESTSGSAVSSYKTAEPARARTQRPAVLRPGFFQRLWQTLHCDPRNLPYSWAHENGRLSCKLQPVAEEQRRWIESESVVDHPDIELRILSAHAHRPHWWRLSSRAR